MDRRNTMRVCQTLRNRSLRFSDNLPATRAVDLRIVMPADLGINHRHVGPAEFLAQGLDEADELVAICRDRRDQRGLVDRLPLVAKDRILFSLKEQHPLHASTGARDVMRKKSIAVLGAL